MLITKVLELLIFFLDSLCNNKTMKPIDLTKALNPYKTGWVAINKSSKVVAWAKTFDAINKKVKEAKNIFIMPASKNYFGFITRSNA